MVSFPVFINICVTENGCKVDITRKNIYNYCNVNLTFGGTMKNRIKELREQRGLTQEQLGELVGASRQAKQKNLNHLSGLHMIFLKYLSVPLRRYFYLM